MTQAKIRPFLPHDCFGAGQKITEGLFWPPDWNTISRADADLIFQSFLNVMQLHQILWYLSEASMLNLPQKERSQICRLLDEGATLEKTAPETLLTTDIDAFREKVNALLKNVCREIHERLRPGDPSKPGGNYMGKNMKNKNLSGTDFSMSLLIAANLEGACLYGANFLGADMRDTNIKNADLSQSLFLTQIQINSAKGNSSTKLPPYLKLPSVWEK